jgi:hypothetical protein
MKRVMKVLVMVVVPLGIAGLVYGIAHRVLDLAAFWATALGWLAALIAVVLVNRVWCYRATFRFGFNSMNR